MSSDLRTWIIYIAPFTVLFFAIPLREIQFFALTPGDMGDGRLNAYFLEHIWQVIIGRAESFVHLPIFYPNLWVGAFSDNHWGTALFYAIPRFFGFDAISSFQIWWLNAYILNFFSALAALRLLRFHPLAATIGALFFTFALPVTAHTYTHAQLSYRFGAPLAITLYILFLLEGDARKFLWALFFTVWQVYASIYIGFFTLIALLFATLAHFRFFWLSRLQAIDLLTPVIRGHVGWRARDRVVFFAVFIVLVAFFAAAFLPYLIPADVYGSSRSRGAIWSMLPRVASYFYTQSSTIWELDLGVFRSLPAPQEHQMWIGLSGMALVAWGGILSSTYHTPEVSRLIWVTLAGIILVTLHSDGVSLWILFAELPLASAIRAMARIDLVMIFLASGLIAVVVHRAISSSKVIRVVVAIAIVGLLIESSFIKTSSTSTATIRDTLATDLTLVPEAVPEDAILFLAQSSAITTENTKSSKSWVEVEVRAMWLALELGIPTLNGYSGKFPVDADLDFVDDCSEAARRILGAYRAWPELREKLGTIEDVLDRVYLVGFSDNCDLKGSLQTLSH